MSSPRVPSAPPAAGRYRYGIVGAGRQGTAAAYDLIVRGEAASVTLADVDPAAARAAAKRVNDLTGTDRAAGVVLDASDHAAVVRFLQPLDAFLGAASYRLNEGLAAAALEAGTNMCDLGGNTEIVFRQLELDARAKAAGIRIVPDCGEAPGLASNLMAYAMSLLDEPEDLVLYDGGLPLHPTPPWNYQLTFSIDGLTNEYVGGSQFIVDGRRVDMPSFAPEEYELVDLGEPVGVVEAFASGGASTTPWTLGPRLRSMRNKVIRYPGHVAVWKGFMDAGLFSEEPVLVDGAPVAPRRLFHALIEPQIRAPQDIEDVVIANVRVSGRTGGRPMRAIVDLRAVRDPELGFSAMERTTGWHGAIVCHLMASGRIPPGAGTIEVVADSAEIVAALRARGFAITESVEPIA